MGWYQLEIQDRLAEAVAYADGGDLESAAEAASEAIRLIEAGRPHRKPLPSPRDVARRVRRR